MKWDKLLEAAKGDKGDAATILICGAVGFMGDAVSTLHGIVSPGYFAGVAASGGLGVKKWISAGLDTRRSKAAAQLRAPNAIAKAEQLLSLTVEEPALEEDRERLRRSIKLFGGNILSIEELRLPSVSSPQDTLNPDITTTTVWVIETLVWKRC